MTISSICYPRAKPVHSNWGLSITDTRWTKECPFDPLTYLPDATNPQIPSCFTILDTSKAFPNIERLEMLTSMDTRPGPAQLHLCPQAEIDYFVKYDVIKNRSHLLPFFMLAAPQNPTDSRDWIPFRQFDWNLIRDESDEVLVGNVADTEVYIEHNWMTTIEGARFPGAVRNAPEDDRLDAGMVWQGTGLKTKHEFERHITARGGTAESPTSIPEIGYHSQNGGGSGEFVYGRALERHTPTTTGLVTKWP